MVRLRGPQPLSTLTYYLINLLINDTCSVYNIYRSARIFRIKEAAHKESKVVYQTTCSYLLKQTVRKSMYRTKANRDMTERTDCP